MLGGDVSKPLSAESESLIFPVAARDEEPEPTTQESMFNFVRLSDGGIQRIANAKSELDILAELGNKIQHYRDASTPFDFSTLQSRQSLRKTIAEVIPGMEALADIDVAKKEFHIQNRLLHEPVFFTESGRANFITQPLPEIFESETFPFRAMSVRSEGQFNSIVYEERDSYRGVEHRWTAMLSIEDMRVLGLENGNKINIRSRYGVMKALEVKAYDLPSGDLMLYYPEANCLIGTHVDPRSKTPAFKSIAVAIETISQE